MRRTLSLKRMVLVEDGNTVESEGTGELHQKRNSESGQSAILNSKIRGLSSR